MIKILKNIVIIIYSNLIIAELFVRQKIIRQNFLLRLGGFGDLIYFAYFGKKNFSNLKFINLGSVQGCILNLCLKKELILDIIFKIPSWRMYYRIFSRVVKSKIIKKTDYDVYKLLSLKNTYAIKKEILSNVKKNFKTSKFVYLKNKLSKKYICFYVKELVDEKFNWFDFDKFNVGNSSEKKKIVDITALIINSGFDILVLGENNELGIDFLYEKYKFSQLYNNKIFFIKDFVQTTDIKSKIDLYHNSCGYIGNGSGHAEFFYFLRKKTIIFDYLETSRPNDINYKILTKMKLRRYLFKKIYCKKNKKILSIDYCNKIVGNLINKEDFCGTESLRNVYKSKYKLLSIDINEIKKNLGFFFNYNGK